MIEGLALPIATHDGGLLGAAGIFWEIRKGARPLPPVPAPDALPASSRHAVEVILLRRLGDRLTMPMFVVGADGRLLFYNPPAEPLLGRPFRDLGRVELKEWYDAFQPTDDDGSRIKREDHPMYLALERQQPTHRRFRFQGLDGVRRQVEGTAIPLIGQCDRLLGAVGVFWEGEA